jgi:hypothetical protein
MVNVAVTTGSFRGPDRADLLDVIRRIAGITRSDS